MKTQDGGLTAYGNWVSKRIVFVPLVIGLVFLAITLVFSVLIIPAWLFIAFSAYFAYARYRFSPLGGNVQSKINDLLLENLDWDGEGQALDIGCGNAPLTIKLAHKYGKARVTGVDCWGKNWEYSMNACYRNAEIEGVKERVTFQKASASALPHQDEHFDAVVSNLVFHEVRDAADKREVVREALRVVKKGGKFAFQDLFLERHTYGNIEDLLRTIRSWGVTKVEFVETRDASFIPWALKLPFMVGTMGIIAGEK
jgi:ubiquinone/menaquinone biosynthesis C-methylase UbiE